MFGDGFDGSNNLSLQYSGYFKYINLSYLRITRLPRLYRLIKLSKQNKLVKKIKKKDFSEIIEDVLQINSSVMRYVFIYHNESVKISPNCSSLCSYYWLFLVLFSKNI